MKLQNQDQRAEPAVKSCGVVVYREKPVRAILLMRHEDRWDFPKGNVDPGETELECAMRELHEETGIVADQIELDPDFRFVLPYTVNLKRFNFEPRLKHLVMFLGRVPPDTRVLLTEHIGYEWQVWEPPHSIQSRTIDTVLESLDRYWSRSR